MTRLPARFAAATLAVVAVTGVAGASTASAQDAKKPEAIALGGVLSGELRAMRSRAPNGKRVNTFQLVSDPRKLPEPSGLCNLETGPETFQIVTKSDAETKQLKPFIGKQIAIRAVEMSCADQAGEMSDAIVSKWSIAAKQ